MNFLALAGLLLAAAPAAQDTFLDPGARSLVEAARDWRRETTRIVEYQAIVRHRLAVGLRTPVRDRTVFRYEGTSKVWWSRDGADHVRVLAARVQSPLGVEGPANPSGFSVDELFDPAGDPLILGIRDNLVGNDLTDFHHPLDPDAGDHYRFRTGDTLRLRLEDGRRFEAIEVVLLPRDASPLLLLGSLWIEPGSGALVQAVYRLADALDSARHGDLIRDPDLAEVRALGGLGLQVRVVVVEYSLWEYRYWLPHRLRAEVVARTAGMEAPGSLEITYEILEVATEDGQVTTATAGEASGIGPDGPDHQSFRRRQQGDDITVAVPRDRSRLVSSPWLPPPIWEDAPGFMSRDEAEALYRRLSRSTMPARRRPHAEWRLPHTDLDLIRYNRVEGLSVGLGGVVDYGRWTGRALIRTATADPVPRAEVRVTHQGLRRTLTLRAHHDLVTATDRGLGVGSSLAALVLGRDDGEFYGVTGAALALSPPPTARSWGQLAVFVERHGAVATGTQLALPALWRHHAFRPNMTAAAADLMGVRAEVRPWWGAPDGAQLGVELNAEAATGDADYVKLRGILRAVASPFTAWRVGAQVEAGRVFGTVLPQLAFRLGGAESLAARPPSVRVGELYGRVRAELARELPPVSLVLFGDAGWAGPVSDLATARALPAVGVGIGILDGYVRVDAGLALGDQTGWRLDLYMDALL